MCFLLFFHRAARLTGAWTARSPRRRLNLTVNSSSPLAPAPWGCRGARARWATRRAASSRGLVMTAASRALSSAPGRGCRRASLEQLWLRTDTTAHGHRSCQNLPIWPQNIVNCFLLLCTTWILAISAHAFILEHIWLHVMCQLCHVLWQGRLRVHGTKHDRVVWWIKKETMWLWVRQTKLDTYIMRVTIVRFMYCCYQDSREKAHTTRGSACFPCWVPISVRINSDNNNINGQKIKTAGFLFVLIVLWWLVIISIVEYKTGRDRALANRDRSVILYFTVHVNSTTKDTSSADTVETRAAPCLCCRCSSWC